MSVSEPILCRKFCSRCFLSLLLTVTIILDACASVSILSPLQSSDIEGGLLSSTTGVMTLASKTFQWTSLLVCLHSSWTWDSVFSRSSASQTRLNSSSGGGRGGGGGGGRGRGRMGGFAAGPGGSCVCPRCGYSTSHVIGTPCYQQTCPKCGSRMTRGS